jgi:hypothetical protein
MKLASLYELSSKNLPNLFWTPVIPQMLFPIYNNLSLPKLYSTEYFGIVYNRLRKIHNPYTDFMKPTNYPDEMAQYIKSRWIPPGADTMLMFKDITIQQKIDSFIQTVGKLQLDNKTSSDMRQNQNQVNQTS